MLCFIFSSKCSVLIVLSTNNRTAVRPHQVLISKWRQFPPCNLKPDRVVTVPEFLRTVIQGRKVVTQSLIFIDRMMSLQLAGRILVKTKKCIEEATCLSMAPVNRDVLLVVMRGRDLMQTDQEGRARPCVFVCQTVRQQAASKQATCTKNVCAVTYTVASYINNTPFGGCDRY